MPSNFWKDTNFPIAIAHRGGGAAFGKEKYRKENTMHAFRATTKLGFKYLEVDVIDTADNQIVVIHVARNKLDRIFYGKKEAPTYQQLEKLTYQQLKQNLQRDIPLLKDVLKAFPSTKFFIDAKTDRVTLPLATLVKDLKASDRVCIGSFFPHRITMLQQTFGDSVATRIHISLSPLAMLRQWRFLRTNQMIAAVDIHYFYTRKWTLGYLHRRGLKVLSWTPNTTKEIERCLALGSDGVMSDNSELLAKVIS